MSNQRASQLSGESSTSNHAIIVLASGLSQRLGQPKQLLCKNGEPLICYMSKLAVDTEPQAIMVVIPDDSSTIGNAIDSAISELCCQYPAIQMVMNPAPETGMAHSLYLGIKALANLISVSFDRVFIMGVDQVLLDKSHITALLASKQAVVASGYHNWQDSDEVSRNDTLKKDIIGLPLVIDYELLKQWQSALAGDKGLRHLIRGLPPSQISTVTNDRLSYDIDTPEQLAYAKQQGWLDE